MNKEVLGEIFNILFPFELRENEYIEIDYDRKDNNFSRALHLKGVQEFIEKALTLQGSNFAIHYTTKQINPGHKKFNRRLARDFVYRMKCVIVDVEDLDNHKGVKKKETVRHWINTVLEELGEELRDAVVLITYTGGGGQIYLALDEIAEGRDIDKVIDYLKEFCKHPLIDRSSLNLSQGQRLIGTVNAKYGIQTEILERFTQAKPLSLKRIKEWWEAKQDIDIEKPHVDGEEIVHNLREAVNQIKKKIKFRDILGEPQLKGKNYSSYLCPFHDEERPSFVVYHNNDGDLAIDYHENTYYDIISFYQKIERCNFIQAVIELARKAKINLKLDKSKLSNWEKSEELKKFNPRMHIEESLNSKSLKIAYENKKLVVILEIQDILGNSQWVKIPFKKFFNQGYVLSEIASVRGEKPPLIKKHLWEHLSNSLIDIADEIIEEDLGFEADFQEIITHILSKFTETDSLKEAVNNPNRIFVDKHGRKYVSFQSLLENLILSFQNLNQSKLAELLNKVGFKPERVSQEGVRRRMWKFPPELDGLDTKNGDAVEENSSEDKGYEKDVQSVHFAENF